MKLSLHTITTRPWSLERAADGYARAGVGGITVWREHLPDVVRGKAILANAGLTATALCRAGFFLDGGAVDDTRRAIDDAAELGAPLLVLVCGAKPGSPLAEQRRRIEDAVAGLEPHARTRGVKLAVEPLHPMYAADRSAIVTLRQARELCVHIGSPFVGIALDVYHVWWDPDLDDEIARVGASGLIFALHLSDFRVPTRDLLNDRTIMGQGAIPVRRIRALAHAAGFSGWDEVEIFSTEHWQDDQQSVVSRIVTAYREHCL